MSQIIINGQPLYQVDLPEMTLAQWQALPVAERPKEWIRTDAEYTDISAENVEFDNTGTDLSSSSVQNAIVEVNAKQIVVPFTLPNNISSATLGQDVQLVDFGVDYSDFSIVGVCVEVFGGQKRTISNYFNQMAIGGTILYGVELAKTFSNTYNGAPASLIICK